MPIRLKAGLEVILLGAGDSDYDFDIKKVDAKIYPESKKRIQQNLSQLMDQVKGRHMTIFCSEEAPACETFDILDDGVTRNLVCEVLSSLNRTSDEALMLESVNQIIKQSQLGVLIIIASGEVLYKIALCAKRRVAIKLKGGQALVINRDTPYDSYLI